MSGGRPHGRMQKAIKTWRKLPDAMPDGESICRLIEAVTEDETLNGVTRGSRRKLMGSKQQ